jgi:hypothetical protein
MEEKGSNDSIERSIIGYANRDTRAIGDKSAQLVIRHNDCSSTLIDDGDKKNTTEQSFGRSNTLNHQYLLVQVVLSINQLEEQEAHLFVITSSKSSHLNHLIMSREIKTMTQPLQWLLIGVPL